MKQKYCALVMGAAAVSLALSAGSARADTEITLWSHWADHETKVAFVEKAAKNFEAKNPGVKVKITWYQKNPLYTALKVALSAGKAPDIFYAEVDQTEYIDNNLLLALDDLVDWSNIEQWARDVWTFNGKVYGFPLEATTNELYYNKDLLKKLGFSLPANGYPPMASSARRISPPWWTRPWLKASRRSARASATGPIPVFISPITSSSRPSASTTTASFCRAS
jgi:multiple sugar transport system substrate-binding protein